MIHLGRVFWQRYALWLAIFVPVAAVGWAWVLPWSHLAFGALLVVTFLVGWPATAPLQHKIWKDDAT